MRALLLAAGLGTRLQPLTNDVPKCLVRIQGRPLLDYWLAMLFAGGVEMALVNTHHLADQVRQFVRNSPWTARVELAHENQLLGTGGTVLHNCAFFAEQPFMVVHADNLSVFNVSAFIAHHRKRPPDAALTMMTFDTDVPQSCGIVVLDGRGIVQEMHEKVAYPPGRRANAAVYIFEPEVVEFMASLGKTVIDISTEVLPYFMRRIYTFHNAGYHRDIGSRESLRKAELEYRRS